jgi:hypothetical protein
MIACSYVYVYNNQSDVQCFPTIGRSNKEKKLKITEEKACLVAFLSRSDEFHRHNLALVAVDEPK